jgi:hypothetical protein
VAMFPWRLPALSCYGLAGPYGALVPLWRAAQRRLLGSLSVCFALMLSLIFKHAHVDLEANALQSPHI